MKGTRHSEEQIIAILKQGEAGLTTSGVVGLFIAQMIRHSSPRILQKYSKATDEYKRKCNAKVRSIAV
jgi:hypothetical protein